MAPQTRLVFRYRRIAVILAVFIGLGIYYAATTPLFEAPDEQWHFAYVQYMATGHGLPVQTPDHPAHLARQEASQPPLYYTLAAGLTFWVDTSDFPGIVWENPHYGYNIPGVVNDNKNLFIHTALENFPYRGAVLAVHLARWLSVLMGALAVLFTYLLTLEIFPDREFLAEGAAALVAFNPQFLFVSSAVSNDSTIVAMSALSLWMTIRLFLVHPRARDVVALGVAVALASLAKVSGLGLVLIAGLVLAYVLRRERAGLVRYLLLFGAVVLLVAGWWYLRNWVLYGELTGTEMMVRIFGARTNLLTGPQLLTQLNEVWETFWVGFGWGNIRAPAWVYDALEILVLLSGIGLVIAFIRRRSRLHPTFVKALPFFVLAAWIVLAFAELVHWMEITQAPHGRLFFPVLPAAAPLAVFGLTQWVPKRVEKWVPLIPVVSLGMLAFAAPLTILAPAYAYPPFLSLQEVGRIPHPVDINYGDKMELLGYEISPEAVLPNQSIELTLYWQSLAPMDTDYSIGIHVEDVNQRVIGSRDSYPGHGLLPTRLWQPGQIIRDAYWVPVAANASAPSVANVKVALYSRDTKADLVAHDPQGRPITPVLGRFKIQAPAQTLSQPQHAMHTVFGQQIVLTGYDLSPDALTLYWKRLAPITADYTVFVHVLDAQGHLLGQQDQEPAGGADPTSLWQDELVVDRHPFKSLVLSPAFRIEIGLYLPENGSRLPAIDARGNPLGDHIELSSSEGVRSVK